jgi:2-polyprenyl-6-methoxyphenol hydroxylase-like FAD-dependent oxidoreductase
VSGPDVDVLVVGAGPTGLALALQAADHGASVRVVERRADPLRPSRALIVHPRTLEVLRPLGVTEALLARGQVAPGVQLHLGDREVPVRLGPFDLPETAFPYLLFVRQTAVEAVLADAVAARGVEIRRGVEVTGLADGEDGPLAELIGGDGPETVACRYLAGCDGPASTIRPLAGVAWRGRPYRQEAVLADVELVGDLRHGVAHAVAGRRGLCFLFALGDETAWRLLATRAAPVEGLSPGPLGPPVPIADVQALLDDAPLPAQVVRVPWSARVPLQRAIASRYRTGRVFLAGDAAHAFSPAGGQGMNTGIQDALNLGWKLAFASSDDVPRTSREPLLDSYELERRPVARRVLAMTHVLFWMEAGSGPLPSFIRGSAAPVVAPLARTALRSRRAVAEGMRTLSQLRVRYPSSPLSVDASTRGAGGARPGDRLPDRRVTTAAGRARLHELLAAPGVHVLSEEGADGELDALGPLVRQHRVREELGAEVVVVRPDGYVGYRGSTAGVPGWLDLVQAPGRHAPRPDPLSLTHER